MSAPRDFIDHDTRVAVAALGEMGRGSLERRARDLAKLLEEREATIRELGELLDRIETLASDPKAYAYDVAAGIRSILRER